MSKEQTNVESEVIDLGSYEGMPIEVDGDGLEFCTLTLKHGGKTRAFVVKEGEYSKLQALKARLNRQDDAQREQAFATFASNVISMSCTENGERVDATKLPARIGAKLEKACMFFNGIGEESEKRAKNE